MQNSIKLLENCRLYFFKSVVKNKKFIVLIFIYLIFIYSLYLFLDVGTMIKVAGEDGPIEYFTFFSFIVASIFFTKAYLVIKNKFFILLAIVFFVGAGEEISWGQRIFKFSTPDSLNRINVQHEFNIHNIETFNGHYFDHTRKTGLAKLLTINYLYKIFWLSFGILLPIIVMLNKKIFFLIKSIKIPIPPLSIGIFFFVNWIVFKIISSYLLSPNEPMAYYYTVSEVMESGTAFIFLVLSYYFFSGYYDDKINHL